MQDFVMTVKVKADTSEFKKEIQKSASSARVKVGGGFAGAVMTSSVDYRQQAQIQKEITKAWKDYDREQAIQQRIQARQAREEKKAWSDYDKAAAKEKAANRKAMRSEIAEYEKSLNSGSRIQHAGNTRAAQVQAVRNGAGGFSAGAEMIKGALMAGGAYIAMKIKDSLHAVIEAGDDALRAKSKIALLTPNEASQQKIFNDVYGLSLGSHQNFVSAVDLYTKIGQSASVNKSLTREGTLLATRTVLEGIGMAGVNKQNAAGAILQLTQGIGSGKLQGQDLRILAEDASGFADMIAKQLYGDAGTIGKMKDDASKGLITSERLIKALIDMSETVHKKFKDTQKLTVAMAKEDFMTRLVAWADKVQNATGIFSRIAGEIESIGEEIFKAGGFADSFIGYIIGMAEGTKEVVDAFGGFGNVLQTVIGLFVVMKGLQLLSFIARMIGAFKALAVAETAAGAAGAASSLAIGLGLLKVIAALGIIVALAWGVSRVISSISSSISEYRNSANPDDTTLGRAFQGMNNMLSGGTMGIFGAQSGLTDAIAGSSNRSYGDNNVKIENNFNGYTDKSAVDEAMNMNDNYLRNLYMAQAD